MSLEEAMTLREKHGLDLVQMLDVAGGAGGGAGGKQKKGGAAPDAGAAAKAPEEPLVFLMNFSQFMYERKQKEKERGTDLAGFCPCTSLQCFPFFFS